jgi:hypothetical protein
MQVGNAIFRWALICACLLASGLACADDVDVFQTRDALGRKIIRVVNRTKLQRWVDINYEWQCEPTDNVTGHSGAVVVGRLDQSDLIGLACGGNIEVFRPVNWTHRVTLTEIEIANDAAEHQAKVAWAQQYSQDVEAAASRDAEAKRQKYRFATCNIKPDGSYRNEDVRYGWIKTECYEWFPNLRSAADQYKKEQQDKQDYIRKLDAQQREEAAYRAQKNKDDAAFAAMRAREQAEMQAADVKARAAEEKRRAALAQQTEQQRFEAERDAHMRADSCFAYNNMRGRSPTLMGYPPNANQSQKAAIDYQNQRLLQTWQSATAEQKKLCDAASGGAKPASADLAANSAAEAIRQQNMAQAQRELRQAEISSTKTVEQFRQSNAALQNSNDELFKLINSMK